MEQILDTIGQFFQSILDNPTVQLGFQLIAIYVVMLWLATALWAYKDMSRRTANPILPYLAAAFIVVFTPVFFIFAAVVYKIVRPGETIAEANERALAEEAMLVEVEAQAHCANCHRRVEHDWIICPSCRNRLRRVCPNCSKLVELDWSLCAWCGKDFERPELLRDTTTTRIPGPLEDHRGGDRGRRDRRRARRTEAADGLLPVTEPRSTGPDGDAPDDDHLGPGTPGPDPRRRTAVRQRPASSASTGQPAASISSPGC